ncbi:cation:proton antiporter [Agromyces atrinae]|uniref:Cation:proton antiporter n=1 Tax=Agromyces atrinae TaxID=592376 RepID=A0A4Q2M5G4_9MICO|nr:cation:proton antiporter [Agromyces atrinae]NYD66514.1 Kef-type K+ transport system membrane component KefB [Agromyces atrinae]RXZ87189.1 cation:proton antiporter [Agromyces atrinae]
MELTVGSLVVVALVAVTAPLLARGIGRWIAIPLVVFEILLGLALGPSGLGWITEGPLLDALSEFGLAMLFFLAGNEVDFRAIRGRPIKRSVLGWLISLALGIALATLLSPSFSTAVFIGIALTSTALGTIMPVLRDAGELRSAFGVGVVAVGAVGEFGPLLAISLFLGGREPGLALVVIIVFAVVAGAAIWLAAIGVGRRFHAIIAATLHSSSQFAVRLVLFILIALVALSVMLGLDMLLGAFTAGVLGRLLLQGAPEKDAEFVESKLEAVGFGFLVPIFFISTGVTFDLDALVSDARTLALVPIFLVLLLVVRGLPSMLSAPPGATGRDRTSLALFGATGLPIIVAVTAIGVDAGEVAAGTAAALVGAGMLSVLIFPLVALLIRRPTATAKPSPDDDVFVPVEG